MLGGVLYFKGDLRREGARLVAPWILASLIMGATVTVPPHGIAQTPASAAQEGDTAALDSALSMETLWDTPLEAFIKTYRPLGFRWLTAAKDSAQITRDNISLFGLSVGQTVLRTKGDKIGLVQVQLYNRGDHGEMNRRDYEALIAKAEEAITNALGVKPVNRGRDASSAVKAEGKIWTTDKGSYLLEYSATKTPFRAEFVRLELAPKEEEKSLTQKLLEKPPVFRGLDHVERNKETGDVVINDIPMVDQGQKGYCVPASSERVLRYYGIRVDANELAQLANSSAEEGTSVQALIDSLKTLTARLRIRTRALIEFDYRQFNQMVEEYNRVAKRRGTNQAPTLGSGVSITDVFERMDADTLRESRTKSKAGIDKFERLIKTHVDKGIPLLWSCVLGVFPEPKRTSQTTGGHMRLIIGYNDKTKEIVFSDSWGAGHESKRLPLVDAYCMTTGLATVEPL